MKLTINPSREKSADLNLLPLFAAVSAEGWKAGSKIIVADIRGECPDIDAGQDAATAHNLTALNRALALTDFRLTSEELSSEDKKAMMTTETGKAIAKRLSKEVYLEYVAELGAALGAGQHDIVISGNHRALVAILYRVANGKFPAGMELETLPAPLSERGFYQENFRLNERNDTTTAIAPAARYLQAVKCLSADAWKLTEQELGEQIYGKLKWCDDSTRDAVQRMRRMLQVNYHCGVILPLDRVPSVHRKNYPIPQEQKADGSLGYSARAALDKTLTVEAFALKMDSEGKADEKRAEKAERVLRALREGAAAIIAAPAAAPAAPAASTGEAAAATGEASTKEATTETLAPAGIAWNVPKLAKVISDAIKGGMTKDQLRDAFATAWAESEQGKAEQAEQDKADEEDAKKEAQAHKHAKGHKRH